MNANRCDQVRWATSVSGEPPLPALADLSALKAQLEECCRARGRMFSMQCVVEAVSSLVVTRPMTTVAVAVILLILYELSLASWA